MADPVGSAYNHTAKKIAEGSITWTTLKLMLLNATAAFLATDATLVAVAGVANVKEVSGNGWAAGGVAVTVAFTTVTTNDAMGDTADITVTAAGGPIGPTSFAVLYDDTGDIPLIFYDLGGAQTANDGAQFKIIINTNGILRLNYTLP